jgi:hypothetical protein
MAAVTDSLGGSATVARRGWVSGGSDRAGRRRAQRREQALHRRPVDQAGDALQPTIGADTRRQQPFRKAPLPNPTLTHPRLATVADPRSESAITGTDKPFRRILRWGLVTA